MAVLAFSTASPGGLANPRPALGATTVEVCGTVGLYVQPTALLAATPTVGGVAYVIVAGTVVPASVEVGAYVGLQLTLNSAR